MTLPASGQISLQDIRTEFSGPTETPLTSYYRGGALVGSSNTGVPTSGQIALSNFYSASASNLLTGLVSWYELSENPAGGVMNDSLAGNNLTVSNPTNSASVAGIVGNAWNINTNGGSAAFAARTSPSGMSAGNYTVGGWFRRRISGSQCFILDNSIGLNQLCFALVVLGSQVAIRKTTNGSLTVQQMVLSTNDTSWHFVVAWIDTAAATINMQLDNGAPGSFSIAGATTTFTSGSSILSMGRSLAFNSSANDATVDQVFYYNRMLTSTERSSLYNSGSGRSFASLP